MPSILINAYACSPDMGSEPGMAWNWCVNLAKYCELHIITEGEFWKNIEKSLTPVPSPKDEGSDMLIKDFNEYGLTETQIRNLHFYYNPIGGDDKERCAKIRKMCWNQGDWRFYKYYKKWQWKTCEMAKDICDKQHIDVLHQLNMIGFREPGYLWKLSKETDIPFVWGPIGGLKQFPMAYADGGGWKMRGIMWIKNVINILQLKYDRRVDKAMKQAALLISSIPDSQKAIMKYKRLESIIIPETGCFIGNKKQAERDFDSTYMEVLWVGKFDFRKRLDIALAAVAMAANPHIVLRVYGSGSKQQEYDAHEYCQRMGIEDWVKIEWMGNRPNAEVHEAMQRAHLFLFTSISEDTSTVVLEAVSNHLPVLCFDTCGMGFVIDDSVGIKVPLSTPLASVKEIANILNDLYNNRNKLKAMSENCERRSNELSWENKSRRVVELFSRIASSD